MAERAHNRLDLTGMIFGRLTVIGYSRTDKNRKAIWRCRCECGERPAVAAYKLTSGHTKSCGCLQREAGDANLAKGHAENFIHGRVGTPTYKSWDAAKQRCFNRNDDHYPAYGGRGITMCERWRSSFLNFLADMGERPEGTTLDRYPDNDGNYEPGNCRWATMKQQSNNRRDPWTKRRANQAAEKITVVM